MYVIKTTMKLSSSKEVQDKLMEGTMAMQQMKSLQEQFKEWKLRYKDVIPTSVRDEKIALQKELEVTQEELRKKEHQVEELEEGTIVAKSLWTKVYLASISAPTLYNIFVYEYTQIKLGIAPHQLWSETCTIGLWRDLWLTIPNRE